MEGALPEASAADGLAHGGSDNGRYVYVHGSRPQAVPHRLFVTPRRPAIFRPDAPASFMRLPIGNNPRCRRSGTSKATELGDRAEEGD